MRAKFQRKPNRHKEWDYSGQGFYFVTICARRMKQIFGKVENGQMNLNKFGELADKLWQEIPKHYENVDIDYYAIMPNHLHGIIIIKENNNVENNYVVTEHCSVTTRNTRKNYGLLSKIVKSYKNAVTGELKKYSIYKSVWQRSFYDRIIRDDEELNKIRQYIIDNPLKWDYDKNKNENLFY